MAKINIIIGNHKGTIINSQTVYGDQITCYNGELNVGGKTIYKTQETIHLIVDGNIEILNADGSVTVNGNVGKIDCGGSVIAGDVNGNVDCEGSVNAKNIGGNVDCEGSVNCNTIKGKIH